MTHLLRGSSDADPELMEAIADLMRATFERLVVVMGACIAIGQAAGMAAALATAEGVALADLAVTGLQDALREDGQLV